mgnify:CR=1 FL=1
MKTAALPDELGVTDTDIAISSIASLYGKSMGIRK